MVSDIQRRHNRDMIEEKSKEEYGMMMQLKRIIKLPKANFNVLCKDLDRNKLDNVASILIEARSRNT